MEQIIYIKMDLALNNLQRLILHKTHKPTNQRQHFEDISNDNLSIQGFLLPLESIRLVVKDVTAKKQSYNKIFLE